MRRIDDLQLNNLKIIQETNHFCFGTDAVALANFAVQNSFVNEQTKICDFCTGNGIIPLLLAGKTPSTHISAIEIQPEISALAKENVEFNKLTNRINIFEGDIKNFNSPPLDIITCNPPYKKAGSGINPKNPFQNIARNEVLINLEEILQSATNLLEEKGKLFMVHKPERLAEICTIAAKHKLETKHLQMVHQDIEKPPALILIALQKNAAPGMTISPPHRIQLS